MADFTLVPIYPARARGGEGVSLVNELEDGSELRREKTLSGPREFDWKFRLSGAELDTLLDFWDTYRRTGTWTAVTYDPQEAAGTEATFRFLKRPEWTRAGADDYETTVSVREVLNE